MYTAEGGWPLAKSGTRIRYTRRRRKSELTRILYEAYVTILPPMTYFAAADTLLTLNTDQHPCRRGGQGAERHHVDRCCPDDL